MKLSSFLYRVMYHTSPLFSDKFYLKIQHKMFFKENLDFENPRTFQEKLQWLKLYDRKPIYHKMVDKYEAKEYVAKKIGLEYTIPTLKLWDSFNDVSIDELPEQFIIKCTHDSGSYYICTNKTKFDKKTAAKKLHIARGWKDYYYAEREWPYKGVRRRIMVEPLLAEPVDLKEYKFFCFNGEPKFYQTCQDRNNDVGGAILHFFDCNGNLMELQDAGHCRESIGIPEIPENLNMMINLSRVIAEETYFLRVDFYEVNSKIYVGEMTFYENGAYCKFTPEKYNRILGDWIKLPIDK